MTLTLLEFLRQAIKHQEGFSFVIYNNLLTLGTKIKAYHIGLQLHKIL